MTATRSTKTASVICLFVVVACRESAPSVGAHCDHRDDAVCAGDGALVCMEDHWSAMQCKMPCTGSRYHIQCDAPEHPRMGDPCWEDAAKMTMRGAVYLACTPDGKARMSCSAGGRWRTLETCPCADGKCADPAH